MSKPRQGPVPSSGKIGQSGLTNQNIQFIQDQCRRGSRGLPHPRRPDTSLVYTRAQTQPKEKNLEDEGSKAEGGSGREGKGRALQRYSTYDPHKARMEGEGKDQCACTHNLDDDMDLLDDGEFPLIKDILKGVGFPHTTP
jgi:hypothetical protein